MQAAYLPLQTLNTITLELNDALTDKQTLVRLNYHEGQKLYRALRELFGDAQYEAQPLDLITMPNARIQI